MRERAFSTNLIGTDEATATAKRGRREATTTGA
jgi:hypothetical protein